MTGDSQPNFSLAMAHPPPARGGRRPPACSRRPDHTTSLDVAGPAAMARGAVAAVVEPSLEQLAREEAQRLEAREAEVVATGWEPGATDDPVQQYLRELRRTPLLSARQERALASALEDAAALAA